MHIQRNEDRSEDRPDAAPSPSEPADRAEVAEESFDWAEYEAWKAAPPEDGVPLWMLDE